MVQYVSAAPGTRVMLRLLDRGVVRFPGPFPFQSSSCFFACAGGTIRIDARRKPLSSRSSREGRRGPLRWRLLWKSLRAWNAPFYGTGPAVRGASPAAANTAAGNSITPPSIPSCGKATVTRLFSQVKTGYVLDGKRAAVLWTNGRGAVDRRYTTSWNWIAGDSNQRLGRSVLQQHPGCCCRRDVQQHPGCCCILLQCRRLASTPVNFRQASRFGNLLARKRGYGCEIVSETVSQECNCPQVGRHPFEHAPLSGIAS